MLQFIQFLEEIERNNRSVVIEAPEAERLVSRFGPSVRGIGQRNPGDGSIEIPMSNILEAVQTIDNQALNEAVEQLKTNLTGFLNSSSAAKQLIETLLRIHLDQFEQKVKRFQASDNPTEVERLRREISQELFGS